MLNNQIIQSAKKQDRYTSYIVVFFSVAWHWVKRTWNIQTLSFRTLLSIQEFAGKIIVQKMKTSKNGLQIGSDAISL